MPLFKTHAGACYEYECLSKEELEIGREYFGIVARDWAIPCNVSKGTWNGEVFVVFTDLGAMNYSYPSDDVKERFLPHALMNNLNARFRVKYTVLENDVPTLVHEFRSGMPYDRALECAQGMADALGLKDGLPDGFMWLTVMPMEVEETIIIEEDK